MSIVRFYWSSPQAGGFLLYYKRKFLVQAAVNFTNRYLRYNEPNLRVGAKDYLTYDMGPTSTLTATAR